MTDLIVWIKAHPLVVSILLSALIIGVIFAVGQ